MGHDTKKSNRMSAILHGGKWRKFNVSDDDEEVPSQSADIAFFEPPDTDDEVNLLRKMSIWPEMYETTNY
jgi:hypothetical protein